MCEYFQKPKNGAVFFSCIRFYKLCIFTTQLMAFKRLACSTFLYHKTLRIAHGNLYLDKMYHKTVRYKFYLNTKKTIFYYYFPSSRPGVTVLSCFLTQRIFIVHSCDCESKLNAIVTHCIK